MEFIMLGDDNNTALPKLDEESERDPEPDVPIWQTLAESTPDDEINRLHWEIHWLKQERWIYLGVGIIAGFLLAALLKFLYQSGLL